MSQSQVTSIVAAAGCLLALIAFVIYDRRMAAAAAEGKPWTRPAQPLLMLVVATVLSIVTAILAFQGR
ncbi:MAG: hypothetical protein FJX75_28925 [Armatimonadetes bacterium]|nr:hypothetical protein [Armatimonadota bacterium]